MITAGELDSIEEQARLLLAAEPGPDPDKVKILRTILRMCIAVREQNTADCHEPSAHPRFLALLDQMREIHIRKARDYGELDANGHNALANMKRSLAMGISPATAAMIRMSDKWSRVQTLYARRLKDGSGPAVADESLSDTLVDLASYALLALILMEEDGARE